MTKKLRLIRSTGVKIDAKGFVIEYKNMPEKLVLQSRHYESVIGISSANRVSILRNPHTSEKDLVPYTPEEDQQIWDFMKNRFRNPKGKAVRIQQKLTGINLWGEFRAAVKTRRFTRSLKKHFNEDMIPSIMHADLDFITKLELLFSLDVTLEDDDLKIIKENTKVLILNRKGAIRYVAGEGFCIGKNKGIPARVSKRALKAQAKEERQKHALSIVKMESFSEDFPTVTEENDEMPNGFLRGLKQKPQLVQDDLTQPITSFPYMPYQRKIGPQNQRGRKRKIPVPDAFTASTSSSSSSTQLKSPHLLVEKKPGSLLLNETTPTTIKGVKVLVPNLASRESSRVSKPTTRIAEFHKEQKSFHNVQPSEQSSSKENCPRSSPAKLKVLATDQLVRTRPAASRVPIPVPRQVGGSGQFLTSGLPMSLRQAPVVARVSGSVAGTENSLKTVPIRFQTPGQNTRLIRVWRPDQVPVSSRTLGTTAKPTEKIRVVQALSMTLPDNETKKKAATAIIPCEENPELLDDTRPVQLETAGLSPTATPSNCSISKTIAFAKPNASRFFVSKMESTPPKRQTVPYFSNDSILRDLGPSLHSSTYRQRSSSAHRNE
uniref:SPK domain-containing protein n=1 Tax=Caenorhabditis japonica TaxID=281687 RepID=A0A8R1I096_CAEJA